MNPQCPYLPSPEGRWTSARMAPFRNTRDERYFEAVSRYAQSLWLEGKPAQALLQLNRALSVEPSRVGEGVRLPYRAKLWIMENAGEGFLGNPVRHYQHLATRVNEPARELRSWRAWACFHLASRWLDATRFPPDDRQIREEALAVPTWEGTLLRLAPLGARGEVRLLQELMSGAPPPD